jgi:glycosyltransferase involved in cell wall biosynthesis
MGSKPLISICVITYRRPEGLQRLTRSLAALEFDEHAARIELNVVDNDSRESARSVCRQAGSDAPFRVNYAVEPRRGIPFARNRSVTMVAPEAEFAVFVDDDEIVTPHWMEELLRVQRDTNADVVAGPVIPKYLAPPPGWVVRGRFHELARHAANASIDRAYTNNTLVRTSILEQMTPPFDERLALTGGSDTHFFRRVHKAGHKMVWAADAVVYDCVPPSRMALGWILQRAFRFGVMTPVIERDIRPGFRTQARIVALGCYRVLKGVVFLPLSWPFGRHLTATYLRHIWYGTGMLAGSFGFRYEEYRKTHGC